MMRDFSSRAYERENAMPLAEDMVSCRAPATRARIGRERACDQDLEARLSEHSHYLEMLSMIERLHRMMLDVIKDEFERVGAQDVNPVQALLMFNIGAKEMTASELKTRGCYLGSNVSYNIKKLAEGGYVNHRPNPVDGRSVKISLTDLGLQTRAIVAELFIRHSIEAGDAGVYTVEDGGRTTPTLKSLEGFWHEKVRYLY